MFTFKTNKTVVFTLQWLLVMQRIDDSFTLIASQLTSNKLRMITYGSTKPWITVYFNLYKLEWCMPAEKHTNNYSTSKQISQELLARHIFRIWYYCIISQFFLGEALTEPARTHLASALTPLTTFICILYIFVHLAASTHLPPFRCNHFYCSGAVKTHSLLGRCRRNLLWHNCCYNTTLKQLWEAKKKKGSLHHYPLIRSKALLEKFIFISL